MARRGARRTPIGSITAVLFKIDAASCSAPRALPSVATNRDTNPFGVGQLFATRSAVGARRWSRARRQAARLDAERVDRALLRSVAIVRAESLGATHRTQASAV